MKYYAAFERNAILVCAMGWMNLENSMLSEKKKKTIAKGHTLYDCIYVICPEWANPRRQKTDL